MKKNYILLALLSLLFISPTVTAKIGDSDCNFKKAKANEVLEKKIGVSGDCNKKTAAKNAITDNIDAKSEKKENIRRKAVTTKRIVKVVTAIP